MTGVTLRLFVGSVLLGLAQAACLSSSVYATMGFTAFPSTQNSSISICSNAYSQFGYCVNQTQVVNFIGNKMYAMTRAILRQGDNMNKIIARIQGRIDGLIANINKVSSNTTLLNITINATASAAASAAVALPTRLLQSEPAPSGRTNAGAATSTTTNATVNATANATLNTTGTEGKTQTTAAGAATVKVTLPGPPAASGNSTANAPLFTQKNGSTAPKQNAKSLNLKAEMVTQLQALKANLTAQNAILQSYTKPEARGNCYQALFKVFIGSLCIATSGAASTYTTVSGSTISSVQISQTDAANVTTHCLPLIVPTCVVRKARALFLNITGKAAAAAANAQMTANINAVCAALEASPTCVQTPSSCSTDIQTLLLKNMITSGDEPFKSDVDFQATSDLFESTDASLNATLAAGSATPSRRLQSGGEYNYQTASGAPSSSSEADKSNVPASSVESSISNEVPAGANGAASSGTLGPLPLGTLTALLLVFASFFSSVV